MRMLLTSCCRVWLDHGVPDPESMSREALIALTRHQAEVIARQDAQITVMATQLADVSERLEQTLEKLAKLEHLLSRNSDNSSMPPSKDNGPGRTPPRKERRAKPSGRAKGKQPGTPGTALRWCEEDELDDHQDRYPEGACSCGADLAEAADLGVVDRYQQNEIPLVSVTVTQYDQHSVACACGRVHTAARPEGAGAGRVEYGPNLRAFAVYLLIVHFVPVHRVVEILTSLTGATPSAGFVHSLLRRAARAFQACDFAIRTLITLAFAVCADETPLKVGPATPAEGKKEAKGYLHVACTDLYTHFLLGDRSMHTFRRTVLVDLEPGAVAVHDRYQTYDSTQTGQPEPPAVPGPRAARPRLGGRALPRRHLARPARRRTARVDPPRQPGPHTWRDLPARANQEHRRARPSRRRPHRPHRDHPHRRRQARRPQDPPAAGGLPPARRRLPALHHRPAHPTHLEPGRT
ncbi:hypothetical protein E4K10_42820 [Streptomyces sp. T1317-0309]|nr:hypothetical protein E4K10_42820 [Streptomyces sp. T1317-0309]